MNEPTRKHLKYNILDLVLVNNRNIISDVDVIPDVKGNRGVKQKVNVGKKWDSNRIRKELQAFTENFYTACEGKSLNEKWDVFQTHN